MRSIKLLDYQLNFIDFTDILELIKKNTSSKGNFYQIISINPENLMLMERNQEFKKLVLSTQTLIADGTGIVWAAKVLAGTSLNRLPGVELMDKLIAHANRHRLRCLLIGGKANLAELTVECYKRQYPMLKIKGLGGIVNIKQPKSEEIRELKRIVSLLKPHLVFVAFGSPAQELWIEANKHLFSHSLVIGVGGAFAMLSGVLPRAPQWLQHLGLEWFYRLLQQPWRIKRQLRLVEFVTKVLQAKYSK